MEILVAMAIFSVVMAAIYTTFISQQRSFIKQEEIAAMQQNLRVALYRMTREIRMAGCDPTGEAGAGVVTAGATEFRFTEDVNGDGEIQGDEDITFLVEDSELKRRRQTATGFQTEAIAENISGLIITYFDAGGAETTDPDQVSSAEIELTAQTAPRGLIQPLSRTLSMRVEIRNL